MKSLIKKLLNEQLVLEATNNNITEMMNLFEENEDNTFTWDIAKEKIDASAELIKTPNQAKDFLNMFFNKIKLLPKPIKIKLSRYVIISLFGLLSIGTISSTLDSQPEIKGEVINTLPSEVKDKVMMPIKKAEKYKQPTKSSESLVDFLKHEEGSVKHKGEPVLKAYKLGDGMITIGWGHAEKIKASKYKVGDKINKTKAEKLLADDIKKAEGGLDRLLKRWEEQGIDAEITQGMYDAMVSMIYNMGIGNFLRSDFIQLVKKGKYDDAADKITKTNVTYPGHIDRRNEEKKMFEG